MLKKAILSLAAVLCMNAAYAQQKVSEPVSDTYDRNSISVVYLSRGDSYDETVRDAIRKYFLNSNYQTKFDINVIPTGEISFGNSRGEAVPKSTFAFDKRFMGIGKEIVAFWYHRDGEGMMDASIIRNRGRYNANDQDWMNSQATKVGEQLLKDSGYDLIKNSYVLVLDYSGIERGTDDKGKEQWKATANLHVYKLGYTRQTEETVFDSWIYDDDDEQTRQAKRQIWEDMTVNLYYVTSESVTSTVKTEDGGLPKAVVSAYNTAVTKIENQVDAWNVRAAINKTKPLRAKIGKKEGLRNGDRFRTYTYRQDADGNIKSVPGGYVRATYISNNLGNATGDMLESQFYQISGLRVSEGALLKQSNDISLGVSLGYRMGAIAGYNLLLDKLISIRTNGISHYALIGMNFDILSEKKLNRHGLQTTTGKGVNFINATVGYGIGLHPYIHQIEFVPYVMLGLDNILLNGEEMEEEATFSQKTAYAVVGGIKLNVNVYYPFQIYAAADYNQFLLQGSIYNERNTYLRGAGIGRENGFSFSFGVKYIF